MSQAQERSIQAQNTFKIKSSAYERKKRADGFRGELLRAVRAALGPFHTDVDYLPAFKEAFQLIYNHRVVFEEQAQADDTFAALQQEHNEAMESAEDKLIQARQLQRQRRAVNNHRQSLSVGDREWSIPMHASQRSQNAKPRHLDLRSICSTGIVLSIVHVHACDRASGLSHESQVYSYDS